MGKNYHCLASIFLHLNHVSVLIKHRLIQALCLAALLGIITLRFFLNSDDKYLNNSGKLFSSLLLTIIQATAFVVTYPVNNAAGKFTEANKAAIAWEEAFVTLAKVFI